MLAHIVFDHVYYKTCRTTIATTPTISFFLLNSFLAFMEFFSSSLILQAMRAICLLLLTINLAIASVSLSHKLGYCNTYGNCGKSRCLANHYHVPSLSLLLRQVRVTREIKINMWKGFRLHLLFSRTN